MFEAYKIGIKISLINNVSSGLVAISAAMQKAHGDATALQSQLNRIKMLMASGAMMTGAGAFGLGLIGKTIEPAKEYAHQLNIMNMAGMKQVEIAGAISAAWKTAGDNVTTTATGNLKSILDLRNITGSMHEAVEFMPIMARMQTILAASKEGKISSASGDLAFSAMKALDIRGAVNDPERLKHQSDLMTRVITGTQGRVTPEQFQQVFQYARQSKFSLSDDFAYKILPTLMLESATKTGGGGGSRGVGPMLAAAYRFTNQGFVNKKSLPLLGELGMLGKGSILQTSTPGTVVAPLIHASLAAENSFQWFHEDVMPKIYKYLQKHKIAATDGNILQIINAMTRGNQLAGSLFGEFYIKEKNFKRDQKLFEGVMSPGDAYNAAMKNDPNTAFTALHSQWQNLKTAVGITVIPVLLPAMERLTKGLYRLGAWANDHPQMTQKLVEGFGALSAAMAIGGVIKLSTAAFKGLGLVLRFPSIGGAAGLDKLGGGMNTLGGGIATLSATVMTNPYVLALMAAGGLAYGAHATLKAARAKISAGDTEGGFDLLGPEASNPWAVSTVKTRGEGNGKMINNTIVMPDGKVLANVVTKEQSREASRPQQGITSFDGRMSPVPIGTP